MICTCSDESCVKVQVKDILACDCTTVINNIRCPQGCTTVILEDGGVRCDCIDEVEPQLSDILIPINVNDPKYFEDVSWTVAYSPILGTWISFYSFYPNYYINHNSYFQTGLNNPVQSSLWSHLLTNKSFQVFYGTKYDFTVEYPVKQAYATKRLNNVKLWTEAKRYANEYDYAVSPNLTFNESLIYNNVNCSGNLILVPQKNNFADIKNYPKTSTNGQSQEILITNKDNFSWTYDYIFNRVKNNNSNIPIITQDKNQIEKVVNSSIIKFKGIPLLKKMEGDWFLNRITYNKDSRFSLSLKFALNDTSQA